jgi:scyllo-inositol 2-dehydrogenase (NADP+)
MEAALGCRTYRNIEDLIADPEVELVDIATRSTEHVEHAVLVLKAGKVVFLENPIRQGDAFPITFDRDVPQTSG